MAEKTDNRQVFLNPLSRNNPVVVQILEIGRASCRERV